MVMPSTGWISDSSSTPLIVASPTFWYSPQRIVPKGSARGVPFLSRQMLAGAW